MPPPSRTRVCRVLRHPLLAVVALAVTGCFGPSVADLTEALDALHPPSAWHVVATRRYGPGGDVDCNIAVLGCPSVIRYYVAAGSTRDAYTAAADMASAAGFTPDVEPAAACNIPPGDAACESRASGHSEQLLLSVFEPRSDVGDVHIPSPTGPIVAVSVFAH